MVFSGVCVAQSLICVGFTDYCPFSDIIYLENREIKGPDQLFSFLLRSSCIDVHSMQINEEVCIKRSTVGTPRSVDCLLKHTFIKLALKQLTSILFTKLKDGYKRMTSIDRHIL
jgi:hypothetical protein